MAVDPTYTKVVQLCFGFYLSIACCAFVLLLCAALLRAKRSPTLCAFFFIAILHAVTRAYLFHVPADFYNDLMKEKGNTTMLILDLLPEVLFLGCYIMFLSTWIEVHFCVRTQRGYSHLRACTYFAGLFSILVAATAIFVAVLHDAIPEGKYHSWTYYQDYMRGPEGTFVTVCSGMVLLCFIVSGVSLVLKVNTSPMHVRALISLRRRITFLSALCTVSFIIRGTYVQVLDNDLQQMREHGQISNEEYYWLFFSYFAVTEILFQYIMMVVLGGGLVIYIVQTIRKGRNRKNARHSQGLKPLTAAAGRRDRPIAAYSPSVTGSLDRDHAEPLLSQSQGSPRSSKSINRSAV
jgi:hypothetical protein